MVWFVSRGNLQNQPSQEQNYKDNITIDRSPALESQSKRLHEYGIDCAHENTYSTHSSLAVDPQNPSVIYVGIEGRGVYKSEDKGSNWKKIIKGLVAYPDMNDKSELCFPDISDIHIDPLNTKHLLMVTSDITTAYVFWPYGETGGIWESLDSGSSWGQLLKGEINSAGSGSIAVVPGNQKIIYYPVNPDPPTYKEAPIKASLMKKGSVYKTLDGGKNWEELAMPMLPGLQALKIFIDPQDSNHVLFFSQSHDHVYHEDGSITEVFLEKQHGVLESVDGGKNFTSWSGRFPSPYGALFEADVSGNNFAHMIVRPFLFGSTFPPDKTVQKSFYSVDGGKSFQPTSLYIWVGRYDPHDVTGNHLLGFAIENAQVVESQDGGKTWEKIATPPEVTSSKVKLADFAWDPKDPSTVYMSGDYGNVWQSINGGKTWQSILSLNKLPK